MKANQGLRQALIITGKTAKASHPSETALDNPTTRQEDKTTLGSRQFDHFQADSVLQGGFSSLLTRVALVNEGDFNRVASGGLHLLSQLTNLSAVLFISGGYMQRQQIAQGIHSQMYFAAFASFRAIISRSL